MALKKPEGHTLLSGCTDEGKGLRRKSKHSGTEVRRDRDREESVTLLWIRSFERVSLNNHSTDMNKHENYPGLDTTVLITTDVITF